MIGASSFAVDIGDPDSTRTVWAIVALLVVMGLGLVMVAFWLRRSTRPDPEFLAPLEVMGERSWRRGDPVWQRRRLDEVRPEGAQPLRRAAAPPRFDESFDDGPSGDGFDDLHEDAADERGVESIADTGAPTRHTPADLPVTAADGSDEAVRDDADHGDDVDASDTSDDAVDADGADEDETREDDRASTPIGSSRPFYEDLPDHEIDPDELRRAMEALDAELQSNRDDRPTG